jgi:hypothetical protein
MTARGDDCVNGEVGGEDGEDGVAGDDGVNGEVAGDDGERR